MVSFLLIIITCFCLRQRKPNVLVVIFPQFCDDSGNPVSSGAGPRCHSAGQRRRLDMWALFLTCQILLLPAGGPEVFLQEARVPGSLRGSVRLQPDHWLYSLQQPCIFWQWVITNVQNKQAECCLTMWIKTVRVSMSCRGKFWKYNAKSQSQNRQR